MAPSRATLKTIVAPAPAPAARRARRGAVAARPLAGAAASTTNTTTTQRIVDSITTAVVERRLMPGTKLAEAQIGAMFKVSRTVVRQALNRLKSDHLVTLEPARGAFIAQPSVEEARQVFEVRSLVESAMIKSLCTQIDDRQIAQLRVHLEQERAAVGRTDVTGRTRLLADFHVVLARMLGNEVLAKLLADLLARCSLVALMYQSSHSAEHSQQEHVDIVDALERRDARSAVRLMEAHLGNVERNLRLNPRATDLSQALLPT